VFKAVFHLNSGGSIATEFDQEEIDMVIRDLLKVPDLVPRLLQSQPTKEELKDPREVLQLCGVMFSEYLKGSGTFSFMGERGRAVVMRLSDVEAVEIVDPDAPAGAADRPGIAFRQNVEVDGRTPASV
jgi:hypothetical protein